MKPSRPVSAALFFLALLPLALNAAEDGGPVISRGQTVYASVYSNVFSGPRGHRLDLATILSIRNTDMKNTLTITAIDYYDTHGKLLKRHLTAPARLGPLQTKYITIREGEGAGGPGANFIVTWRAVKAMNAPIIETVMVGTRGGQGISFVTPGRVLAE